MCDFSGDTIIPFCFTSHCYSPTIIFKASRRDQPLKRLAQKMVFCLEEQANYLRIVFGIERPAPTPLVQAYSPMSEAWKQGEEYLEEQEEDQDYDVRWKRFSPLYTSDL